MGLKIEKRWESISCLGRGIGLIIVRIKVGGSILVSKI